MDIGASTGGFTEVLLEMEQKIYAIDVGQNQLVPKLNKIPKLFYENTDIRT